MVIALARDPGPVLPRATSVAHPRAKRHRRAHTRLHLSLPDWNLQTLILGYCYADPGRSTVLITPALICTHARGV